MAFYYNLSMKEIP